MVANCVAHCHVELRDRDIFVLREGKLGTAEKMAVEVYRFCVHSNVVF